VRAHKTGLENIEKLPGWLLVVGTRARSSVRPSGPGARPSSGLRYHPRAMDSDASADRVDLLAALGELPSGSGQSSWPANYYGLSYDEIADHFDIKSGTVGATLHQSSLALARARRRAGSGRSRRSLMQGRADGPAFDVEVVGDLVVRKSVVVAGHDDCPLPLGSSPGRQEDRRDPLRRRIHRHGVVTKPRARSRAGSAWPYGRPRACRPRGASRAAFRCSRGPSCAPSTKGLLRRVLRRRGSRPIASNARTRRGYSRS